MSLAFNGCVRWIFGRWPRSIRGIDIQILEMWAVVLAINSFFPDFVQPFTRISLLVDNTSVVYALLRKTSRNSDILKLLKWFVEWSAERRCIWKVSYIATSDNVFADALSRRNLERFQEFAEDCDRPFVQCSTETRIPNEFRYLFD